VKTVNLRGAGSFLPIGDDMEEQAVGVHGGVLAVISSTQGRDMAITAFNEETKDFAIADSHGQIFYFNVNSNKYQLVRLAGTSPVSTMCFLHAKLHYLCVAYEAGNVIVIDTIARKSVLSMQAEGSSAENSRPIRMLRCHPKHSKLVGYSDGISVSLRADGSPNIVPRRSLSIYDLKQGIASNTMEVHEDVLNIQFIDPAGRFFAVLFAKCGVVVYRSADCSVALTCPFPDSERMPKWTAMTVLTSNASTARLKQESLSRPDAANANDNDNDETPQRNIEDDDYEDDEPMCRLLCAGDNAKLYMWESPSAYEMNIAEVHNFRSCCIVSSIVELPPTVKGSHAVFLSTLSAVDQTSAAHSDKAAAVCKVAMVSDVGTVTTFDVAGAARGPAGSVGMWTIMSDFSKLSGAAAVSRVSGISSGASAEFHGTRIDGILSAAGYMFAITCQDGTVKLYDSDLSVGTGPTAGLLLHARAPHVDLPRVPVLRYSSSASKESRQPLTVLAAPPRIEVKEKKGIKHSGKKTPQEIERAARQMAENGRRNVDEKEKADSAQAKAAKDKQKNVLRAASRKAKLIAAQKEKAKASAAAAVLAKQVEKQEEERRAEAAASVGAAKAGKRSGGMMSGKLSAAEEIAQARQEAHSGGNSSGSAKGGKTEKFSVSSLAHIAHLHSLHELALSHVQLPQRLTEHKLRNYLHMHDSFPAKHRPLVWRHLLRLPENTAAWEDLVRRGTHPAYATLNERYPLRSRRVFARLQNVCSQLAHWSPCMAVADWLPQFAFPFVLLFGSDEIATFETIMSLTLWWGFSWWATHPNPPVHIIDGLDALVYLHEPRLYAFMADNHRIAPGILGWTMLSTLFTEVLSRDVWHQLMDYLVCHMTHSPPSGQAAHAAGTGSGATGGALMLLVPVSILTILRPRLLSCHSEAEIMDLLRSQAHESSNNSKGRLDAPTLIKVLKSYQRETHARFLTAMPQRKASDNADAMRDGAGETNEVEEARECLALCAGSPNFPLPPGGRYPAFDGFPTQVVKDWQLRDRNKAMSMDAHTDDAARATQLTNLTHRVEHMQKAAADQAVHNVSVSRMEENKRSAQMKKEADLLKQLLAVEQSIAKAKSDSQAAKEAAVKAQLEQIDRAAHETRKLVEGAEQGVQARIDLQLQISKSRELGEAAEAAAAARIGEMLQARSRQEHLNSLQAAVDAEVDEDNARQAVLRSKAGMADDLFDQTATQRARLLIQEQQAQTLSHVQTTVISDLQKQKIAHESQMAHLEQARALRIAQEQAKEALESAKRSQGYLLAQEELRDALREASATAARNEKQANSLDRELENVRAEAEKERFARDARVRAGVANHASALASKSSSSSSAPSAPSVTSSSSSSALGGDGDYVWPLPAGNSGPSLSSAQAEMVASATGYYDEKSVDSIDTQTSSKSGRESTGDSDSLTDILAPLGAATAQSVRTGAGTGSKSSASSATSTSKSTA